MQNYEALLEELRPLEKTLKDSAAAVTRLQKAVQKHTETGNLSEAKKSLAALAEELETLRTGTEAAAGAVNGFDTREYLAGGDFARQLLDCCKALEINVVGEKGVYEMFPYRLRILGDEEHPGEVWLDRKKLNSFRPSFVAETVKAGQTRLYSANFKAAAFMNELAEAYETACMKENARVGSTQALTKIYRCLAPTARARRDYDAQAYAFDLARLYEEGPENWISKNGVRYTFGTSRNGSGIRVLSRTGVEAFVSTLRALNDTAD